MLRRNPRPARSGANRFIGRSRQISRSGRAAALAFFLGLVAAALAFSLVLFSPAPCRPDPLDQIFLQRLKGFLDEHAIALYSEHLSWCSDGAHLYDLLPIPFTADAVKHVAARIRRTQDILGRRIAVENASFYTPLASELSEPEFLLAILAEAGCDLLLDVNNVYVNSVNHRYDPRAFIDRIPADRVAYLHVAGHYNEAPDLIVDTHGADVVDPVWQLLEYTYDRIGVKPTLLERDFNIPPLPQLLAELRRVRSVQAATGAQPTASGVRRHAAV